MEVHLSCSRLPRKQFCFGDHLKRVLSHWIQCFDTDPGQYIVVQCAAVEQVDWSLCWIKLLQSGVHNSIQCGDGVKVGLLVENCPFLSKLDILELRFCRQLFTAARVQAPIRGTSASLLLGHHAS